MTANLKSKSTMNTVGNVVERYMNLKPSDRSKCMVEYVWIDSTGELHSKAKLVACTAALSPKQLPRWSYDVTSTKHAPKSDDEVSLVPVALYKDPFRKESNCIALCETISKGKPAKGSNRSRCQQIMKSAKDQHPWFGVNQTYTIIRQGDSFLDSRAKDAKKTLQDLNDDGIATATSIGRNLAECHLKACLYAGVSIFGMNSRIGPSQQSFQIGICEGLETADDLWMARYILHRVAEDFGVNVSFDAKQAGGASTSFSTAKMRETNGFKQIKEAIKKLAKKHSEHMSLFTHNEGSSSRRHEVGSNGFTWGVGTREASVEVPISVKDKGSGYLVDRRPPSNMDPYQALGKLVETCCLVNEEKKPCPVNGRQENLPFPIGPIQKDAQEAETIPPVQPNKA